MAKNPMVALGELRDVVMNSVLPVSPMSAQALIDAVGAGLAEKDEAGEQVPANPADSKVEKAAKRKR